jgi:stearoyl-CoA desaturase (delta-9 desaturase)
LASGPAETAKPIARTAADAGADPIVETPTDEEVRELSEALDPTPLSAHITGAMFIAVQNAAIVLAFVVGVSWVAVAACVAFYLIRMFAITAGYHRYFAHRSYKTSRAFQFFLGFLGTTAVQKGPLWWASHHRHHHKHSDQEEDIHSPTLRGFLWAHVGWIMAPDYTETDWKRIGDFAKYPELRWLNKYSALGIWALFGAQIAVWAGLVSTVCLWHGTFTINSLCHVFGKRVYKTTDTSRNSLILALITLGEGWHNNHHYHQASANQGFRWWEIDISFYILLGLEKLGIVWDVKRAPEEVIAGNKGGRNHLIESEVAQAA